MTAFCVVFQETGSWLYIDFVISKVLVDVDHSHSCVLNQILQGRLARNHNHCLLWHSCHQVALQGLCHLQNLSDLQVLRRSRLYP